MFEKRQTFAEAYTGLPNCVIFLNHLTMVNLIRLEHFSIKIKSGHTSVFFHDVSNM